MFGVEINLLDSFEQIILPILENPTLLVINSKK